MRACKIDVKAHQGPHHRSVHEALCGCATALGLAPVARRSMSRRRCSSSPTHSSRAPPPAFAALVPSARLRTVTRLFTCRSRRSCLEARLSACRPCRSAIITLRSHQSATMVLCQGDELQPIRLTPCCRVLPPGGGGARHDSTLLRPVHPLVSRPLLLSLGLAAVIRTDSMH
jgi:hypothetical protein